MQVKLNRFHPTLFPGVCYIHAHLNISCGIDFFWRNPQIAVLYLGITEPVPERIERGPRHVRVAVIVTPGLLDPIFFGWLVVVIVGELAGVARDCNRQTTTGIV